MRELKGASLIEFPESYVVIDVETTGFDPSVDCLIELAALRVVNNEIKESYSSFVKSSTSVPPHITELTGITSEQLKDAPEPQEALLQFHDFVGDNVVVGHNVNFDINFLYDNFKKYLGIPFSNDYVDTLKLSRKYCKQAPLHKLSALADFLRIPVETAHRALADCTTTNSLYLALKEAAKDYIEKQQNEENKLLLSLNFDTANPFFNKKIAIKGLPQLYSFSFMKAVSEKCHANLGDIFYKSCDFIVFSNFTYKRWKKGEFSEKFEKANELAAAGSLQIISETQWCEMLHLPIPAFENPASFKTSTKAKDISTDVTDFDVLHPLYDRVCVFTGALEKMSRKEAMQMVADLGGQVGDSVTRKTNYLILGNNDYCASIKNGKSSKQAKAESLKASGQDIEIISENVFYDMIFD